MPNTKKKSKGYPAFTPPEDYTYEYKHVDYLPTGKSAQHLLADKRNHELLLAKANEREAVSALKATKAENKDLRAAMVAITDLLPWRDYTAHLTDEVRDEVVLAIVNHWLDRGVPLSEARMKADLWWKCPTCRHNINAGPDDGEHVYCEYSHPKP